MGERILAEASVANGIQFSSAGGMDVTGKWQTWVYLVE